MGGTAWFFDGTRVPLLARMAAQPPIVSLEEAETPPITLSSLLLDHYDLLLEILNALLCDYGLSGLAGSCKSLRLPLTRPQKKYGCTEAASLYDERVAELVDLQGWRSRPLTITSRLASRPRNNAPRTHAAAATCTPPARL